MTDSYPFKVKFINGATFGSPEQMYSITADFASQELHEYKSFFDRYGVTDGRLSLVDVTALIIEGNIPDLLDHMDFDEEGYLLDMHADSEEAVQGFISIVCKAFQDFEKLERYVLRIATADE